MLSAKTRLRPELAPLASYNSGLTLADVKDRCGGGPIAKLGSNENPYPAAPEVAAAMAAALGQAHVYPDPGGRALAEVLSARTGVPTGQILFGDGSEDLLNVLARCLLGPGDEVVTLYPSFPLHEDYAVMMGAGVTRIGLTPDHAIDMAALLSAAARPVRLILIANPMNPAGLWLSPEDLDALLAAQHPDAVLCLDEAYVEYARGAGYMEGTARLMSHDKPLLVLRTFSKAYGMAGLRIGYGLSNDAELVRGMNLVRTPFNVNAPAQAGALAALAHEGAMRAAVAEVTAERARMAEVLTRLGCRVLPSRGNFLFVETGQAAVALADRLVDGGVIVKPWKQPGYETWLRVSVGLRCENDQFLAALAALL
ncbi:histidinol-phosphate transaminase [Acidimangrovimonas sediminis]|uniref:histidinol-phosphate transaminase n=1 Tax=Acidimangrovimonas sediminis TaxID=2056283 RepID=UPI000C7F9F8C|nr:histidinol-phosphate transaminase [Acidimangrovimonas sediminis]